MRRSLSFAVIVTGLLFVVSACNKTPDHARYIPKDALAVVGVNFKALGKKVAWNVITGSKLFKEMQARMPEKNNQDAMNGLENAGLDVMNTFYMYVKGDKRTKNNRIVGVIPLSSQSQWEGYVKKAFPQATIKQQGDVKEANLAKGMYAGWKDNILIIMNALPSTPDYKSASYGDAAPAAAPVDDAGMAVEMENAFKTPSDNALSGVKRFTALQEQGHDVTLWVNYDQLMTDYGADGLSGMTGGLSLSNSLWKEAVFTGGFDFGKGDITGEMHYYMPDAIKDICKELGSTNADKGMIDMLPGQNMDMLMAWHLSPKGLKDLLDKFGVLGFANIAVAQKGQNVDDILAAFTGDMAFVMNDFAYNMQRPAADSNAFMSMPTPTLSGLFIIKINKKDNFNKLMQLVSNEKMLLPVGTNTFAFPMGMKDSIYLMYNDKYAVIGNKLANVTSYLNGGFKGQKMVAAASSEVYGHPYATFFDVQQMVKNINGNSNSPHDAAMMVESKKLLDNTSFTGGEYKDGSFEFHAKVNFMNKEENSLIELLDFAQKMSDADKTAVTQ